MRGRFVIVLFAVAFVAAFSASAADVIVLKDGRSISLAKPWVAKGKMAILTLPDKSVLSVPISEIDKEKTAEARAKLSAPQQAAAPAAPARPLTPAEAAKVKSARKAVVSLTDDSVAHPAMTPEGTPAPEGGGKVELGPVSVKKVATGYNVTGTLMNTGKGEAIAVSMTVEAVGDDGRSVASGFASLAKDTLTSGEKTTFTVDIPTSTTINNFKYTPKWTEKAPPRVSVASGSGQQGQQQAGQGQQGQETPPPAKAEPKQEEAPKPAPRGDVAAPPANAPVGQPTEPGGTYIPQPSPEGQPKLP